MYPEQHILLDPTPEDLAIRNILKDAVGEGATKRIAQRKLDATGGINAYCCNATAPDRKRQQHDALHLAASLAEINEDDRKEANEKVAKAEKNFHQLAPVAL